MQKKKEEKSNLCQHHIKLSFCSFLIFLVSFILGRNVIDEGNIFLLEPPQNFFKAIITLMHGIL